MRRSSPRWLPTWLPAAVPRCGDAYGMSGALIGACAPQMDARRRAQASTGGSPLNAPQGELGLPPVRARHAWCRRSWRVPRPRLPAGSRPVTVVRMLLPRRSNVVCRAELMRNWSRHETPPPPFGQTETATPTRYSVARGVDTRVCSSRRFRTPSITRLSMSASSGSSRVGKASATALLA